METDFASILTKPNNNSKNNASDKEKLSREGAKTGSPFYPYEISVKKV